MLLTAAVVVLTWRVELMNYLLVMLLLWLGLGMLLSKLDLNDRSWLMILRLLVVIKRLLLLLLIIMLLLLLR